MSEDTSTVIDLPEGDHQQDGDQADQSQHLQHSNEPDTTDRSTDTSISINEATPVNNNSLGQQNDQERPDIPFPASSTLNRVPLILEKALLIDISVDKECVASLVERSEAPEANKQYYLKMNKLYDTKSKSFHTSNLPTPEIAMDMPQDMDNYYYFLSVSPEGKRAAVSFLPAQERSKMEEKNMVKSPKCLVFKLEENTITLENDKLKLQGKAAFLPNGHLALINTRKIEVYDCETGYKLKERFDMSPLYYSRTKLYTTISLPLADTGLLHTTSSVNQHQKADEPLDKAPVELYLQLSKLVKCNGVLTTTYGDNTMRLWSLETGCRLASFKTPTREIPLALSSDKRFIATFSKSTNTTNIYHVKTGLLANTLGAESLNDPQDQRSKTHQIVYAEFCREDALLVMMKICQLEDSNSSIAIEIWDISAEKAIFRATPRSIRLDWSAKNSYVEPFVIELSDSPIPLPYTAIYTTLTDDGKYQFESTPLDIFKPRYPSEGLETKWISQSPRSLSMQNLDNYREIYGNLNNYNNAICFRLRQNLNILLRIGMRTVQLWDVSDTTSQEELSGNDRIIYICSFKPPVYARPNQFVHNQFLRKSNTSLQSHQTGIESLNNTNNAITAEAGNEPFSTLECKRQGIAFVGNNSEKDILSIEIHHEDDKDGFDATRMEVYLPTGESLSRGYVCAEHHHMDSAISALYYLNSMPKSERSKNSKMVYDKTKKMVICCVEKMIEMESRYFTTLSGSYSLARLSMFADGRDILFLIIQNQKLAINLFTYIHQYARTEKHLERASGYENALTILIKNQEFSLYNLLLNRVILHSKELGAGCYVAITDALIFLEKRGDTDILRSSCEKLQFLNMNPEILPIVRDEILKLLPLKRLHKKLKMEFQDLKPNATTEQLPRYGTSWIGRFIQKLTVSCLFPWYLLSRTYSRLRFRFAMYRHKDPSQFLAFVYNSSVDTSLVELCVVPYVYLCSYDIYGEDIEKYPSIDTNINQNMDYEMSLLRRMYYKLVDITMPMKLGLGNSRAQAEKQTFLTKLKWSILEWLDTLCEAWYKPYRDRPVYKKKSTLMKLALNQHENDLFSQEYTVLEVLLYFKWKKKLKFRFLFVCFIHSVYYVSFSVGVLFAVEVFDYTVGMPIANYGGHMATIVLMLVSCGALWVQEVRQFFKIEDSCLKYFRSFYNWVDLAALTLPIVNLLQMLHNEPGLDELSAITTIILWLHGVLRLRAFAFIGVTLETIIQLIRSVYKTLLIMLVVVFAFTNAFIVLLARKDDAYFQEKYSGFIDLEGSGSSTSNTVSYSDSSSSNNFKNPVKAFATIWLFIYGVWDPINDGDAGDNYMIMALAFLFSLLAVLLFFNLVVALMSSRAEEVKALGRSVWLSHFAEVIAEVEQLWCTKSERVSRENSPSFIFYIAKKTDIRRQADSLEDESNALVQKLQERHGK